MSDRSKKRYNQEEIGAVIQRASQLREERLGNSDQHLSLDEIEHIAAELDIPADLVRSAALELEQGPIQNRPSVFGAPFRVSRTRSFSSSMTDDQWNDLVVEIRSRTGKRGTVEESARLKEWLHATGEGDSGINFTKTAVTVRTTDEQTSVQMERRFGGAAAVAYALTLFFTTLFSVFLIEGLDGLGLSTATNFAIFFGFILSGFGIVRGTVAASARNQEDNFSFLMDRFADILQDDVSVPESVGGQQQDVVQESAVASDDPVDSKQILDLEDEIADDSSGVHATRKRDKS